MWILTRIKAMTAFHSDRVSLSVQATILSCPPSHPGEPFQDAYVRVYCHKYLTQEALEVCICAAFLGFALMPIPAHAWAGGAPVFGGLQYQVETKSFPLILLFLDC